MDFKLRCIACSAEYPPQEIRYNCACGGLLDVEHDPQEFELARSPEPASS